MTAVASPLDRSANQAVLDQVLGGPMRTIRTDRGERLIDVARQTGVRVTSACAWEQGRAFPKPRYLILLIKWAKGGK